MRKYLQFYTEFFCLSKPVLFYGGDSVVGVVHCFFIALIVRGEGGGGLAL